MSTSHGPELHADYLQAGFSQRLGFGASPALLMIDFSRAYFERGSPLFADTEPTRLTAIRVLEAARAAGIPVLHTRVEIDPSGVDAGVFWRKVGALKVFCPGSPLAEFVDGLEPRAGEIVVTKQYASAFFGTSLAATLTFLKVDTVVIAGVSTSGCVRASAVDAMQHGFVPVVLADAVGDRAPGPHHANLFDLQAKYADVIGSAEFLGHLAQRSS